MSAATETTGRLARAHPKLPLSKATVSRLLQGMLQRAEAGDNDAAQRLIEMAQRRSAPAAAE